MEINAHFTLPDNLKNVLPSFFSCFFHAFVRPTFLIFFLIQFARRGTPSIPLSYMAIDCVIAIKNQEK